MIQTTFTVTLPRGDGMPERWAIVFMTPVILEFVHRPSGWVRVGWAIENREIVDASTSVDHPDLRAMLEAARFAAYDLYRKNDEAFRDRGHPAREVVVHLPTDLVPTEPIVDLAREVYPDFDKSVENHVRVKRIIDGFLRRRRAAYRSSG